MSSHARPKGELPFRETARSAKGARFIVRAAVLGWCGAALALAACGEKTTGAAKKSDVPAFQGSTGASAYMDSGWKAGDQSAWEQHMRSRTQGQNEYARTATKP
jgi:hypothetical protein